MITAQHRAWAHWLFRPYLRWLCKRRFHALELLGDIPELPDSMPILLAPNHATWWDGFFPYLLNDRVFRRKYYIMMLEHRLREFWFFRLLGAFSINQQSPKGIVETLSYTASLLSSSRKKGETPLVVMFPQGELRPSELRPLGYNRGIERVVSKTTVPLAVVPLAVRCVFLSEEKPFVFMECGTPHILTPDSTLSAPMLEQEMSDLLERLQQRIIASERGRSMLGK
jgi:1-acyl-sn-glycerol-3-phosphate acyltransferase